MLILARRAGESLSIGDNVMVTVQEVGRTYVRLRIDAPDGVRVNRCDTPSFAVTARPEAGSRPGRGKAAGGSPGTGDRNAR